MAFTPENLNPEQAEAEVHEAWSRCYDSQAIAAALEKIEERPFVERALLFITRLAFRGIYFPQMTTRHWASLLFKNRRTLLKLIREAFAAHREHRGSTPPVQEVAWRLKSLSAAACRSHRKNRPSRW